MCQEIELNVCRNKDEEECKKGIFFLKNEYFSQYKCGFFIWVHSDLIDSPITVSFGIFF